MHDLTTELMNDYFQATGQTMPLPMVHKIALAELHMAALEAEIEQSGQESWSDFKDRISPNAPPTWPPILGA